MATKDEEREMRKKERQVEREKRREEGNTLGQMIKNDFKTLGNGIRDDFRDDWNALKGKNPPKQTGTDNTGANAGGDASLPTGKEERQRKNKKESNVNPDDVAVANGKIPEKESTTDLINNTRPTPSQEEIDELKRKAENGEDLNAKPEEKPFDKAATEEFSNRIEQRQEDFHNSLENIKSQTNPDDYVPQNTEEEETPEAPAPETTQTQTTETPAQTQTPATTQTRTDYNYTAYGKNGSVFNDNGYDDNGIDSRGSRQAGLGNAVTSTTDIPEDTKTDIPEDTKTDIPAAVVTAKGAAQDKVATNQGFIDWYNQNNPNPLNAKVDFKGIREEMGYNPNAPIAPTTETEKTDLTTADDSTLTTATGAGAGGGATGVGSAGGTEGGGAGGDDTRPQPPAIPNAEDDETVKGIEQATETRKQGYDDYLNFIEDFLAKKEEYDKLRSQQDASNAFWRGIGEVGASLVNLLGVTGAFGGKNAYGRGNYSSMQKFDLTTGKLTDKMKADMEKRKEQMDALRLRQAENRLKLSEILAGGQEKAGTAKGAAAEKQYTREYTRYKDQATVGESARQFNETMNEKKREFDITNQTNKEIAALNNNTKLYLANYEQNGKTENKLVDWTFNIDGKPRTLRARAGSLYKVFETTSTRLADEIAKTMGFDNYERYKRVLEGIDSKNKDTKADSQNELEDMRRRYIRSNVSGATVKFDDEGNITDVEVPEGTSEAAKANALAVAEKYAEMWNDHISRLEGYENAKSEIDWDGSMTGSNKNFVTNWVMEAGPYYDRYGQYVADFLETQAAILGESNDPDENGFV